MGGVVPPTRAERTKLEQERGGLAALMNRIDIVYDLDYIAAENSISMKIQRDALPPMTLTTGYGVGWTERLFAKMALVGIRFAD